MDTIKLKNMVVLKNLPSNIVDEAFVILKSNKKVKKLEKIEKNKNQKSEVAYKKDKAYMLKEAEMLIADYISKIENKDKNNIKQNEKKIKKTKITAYISTLIAIVEFIIIIS